MDIFRNLFFAYHDLMEKFGSHAVTFNFLKINKNLFYDMIILFPRKEELFPSFITAVFEIDSSSTK